MEKVPAEFLEDAIRDLFEIFHELRSVTAAGLASLPHIFLPKLLRLLHTIKGSAQTFGLTDEAALAHQTETLLAAIKEERIPWNAKSEDILANALYFLRENLALISENKEGLSFSDIEEEIAALLQDTGHIDGELSLPDSFPREFLNKLSRTEMSALDQAWRSAKEILILEFAVGQKEFAVEFKQIRGALETKAEILAISSGLANEKNTLFRFLIAVDQSESLIDNVRQFEGRVLFQKRKETGEVVLKSVDIGAGLNEALLHGEKAAASLGKKVKFTATEDSAQIPPRLSRLAATILLHLVRNAVDHGVEFPLERAALKTPARGSVEIAIGLTETDLLLSVCDDGRGIESTREIFNSGYTTAPFVTELSGRGIGLDIVWDAVQRANGMVKVNSKPGRGTKFEIDLPLENK
jgi:two-component system chemotaxis sensor kinase CheA